MSRCLDSSKKNNNRSRISDQLDKSDIINFSSVPKCQFPNKGIIQFTKFADIYIDQRKK